MIAPADEREVAEALRACAAEGRRVRISGGGVLAVPPSEGVAGLRLALVAGVVEIRAADLVATARAGTTLADLAAALTEHGRRFPLPLGGADPRATVGGLFATGARGLRSSLGFGARDLLLGARAALGNGDVVAVGARVVKSVAGFDVCKALVGSRGVLAAITEVTFRIEAGRSDAGRFEAGPAPAPEAAAAPPPRSAPSPLLERVRRAFDPQDLFEPGRGFGAP